MPGEWAELWLAPGEWAELLWVPGELRRVPEKEWRPRHDLRRALP